jgi:hypothetical protein
MEYTIRHGVPDDADAVVRMHTLALEERYGHTFCQQSSSRPAAPASLSG